MQEVGAVQRIGWPSGFGGGVVHRSKNPIGPAFRDPYPNKMQLKYDRDAAGVILPAWNVKVYKRGVFDPAIVRKHFKCDQKQAEKAVEWAWESSQEQWWEQAQQDAEYHLSENIKPSSAHHKVKVGSSGRSGGWLVLRGLPDIPDKDAPIEETFDAETMLALGKFEEDILGSIDFHLNDEEGLLETIEMNSWCGKRRKKNPIGPAFQEKSSGLECWDVWSIDAWASGDGGWDWNDRARWGHLCLKGGLTSEELKKIVRERMFNEDTPKNYFTINDSGDESIVIENTKTGKPYYELVRNKKKDGECLEEGEL
jgi:hypothetical protein